MQTDESRNILRTYLHVQNGNRVALVDAPGSFWPDLAAGAFPQLDEGRLMSAFTFSSAWESWERHPAGEELVMLLSGSAELILEEADGQRRVPLTSAGEFVLVPPGVWHTATTEIATTLLFLTPGAGTQHRPV